MNKRPYILCLGDSLTEFGYFLILYIYNNRFNIERHGYCSYLANYYSPRLDIINRGFGGYNTKYFLYKKLVFMLIFYHLYFQKKCLLIIALF